MPRCQTAYSPNSKFKGEWNQKLDQGYSEEKISFNFSYPDSNGDKFKQDQMIQGLLLQNNGGTIISTMANLDFKTGDRIYFKDDSFSKVLGIEIKHSPNQTLNGSRFNQEYSKMKYLLLS